MSLQIQEQESSDDGSQESDGHPIKKRARLLRNIKDCEYAVAINDTEPPVDLFDDIFKTES